MTALPALQQDERTLHDPAEDLVDARPRRLLAEQPQAPYRRPPVVRRHRRRRMLSLLKILGQALVIVALPTVATAWALTTPQFALERISVATSERVPAAWVLAELAPLEGRNLFRVSLKDARSRLQGHPWLESASLRKRLPDTLEVVLVEKTPVAVLEGAGSTVPVFVDPQGEVIAPVEPGSEAPALPRIRGSALSARALAGAIATAEEFERLASGWGGRLTRIEVLGPEDFQLEAEGLPLPLVVRRGSLEEKSAAASRLLPEILSRVKHVRAVDLRFAQRIVLQPEPGSGGLVPSSEVPSRG